MMLTSVLDLTFEQAEKARKTVNSNNKSGSDEGDSVHNYVCDRQKTAPIVAKSGGYYQVSISCERRKSDYLVTAEALLVQTGMTRRFTLDRSFYSLSQ